MSVVEIRHTDTEDPATTRLHAVLRGRELAGLDLRWSHRTDQPASSEPLRVQILRLDVDPTARGRGTLGRLLERLAVIGRDRGVHHVDVTVHHAAVDLCTTIGFQRSGAAFWVGTRRFVPMSLDVTTWSTTRGHAEVTAAVARLGRTGFVDARPAAAEPQPERLGESA
jgi:GNAT superfamily N-acetyltransferase